MQPKENSTEKRGNGNQTEIEKLFDAVTRGDVAEVEKLLGEGLSPDSRDKMERTPLMVAAEAGNAALVEKLLDHEADVNAVDVDGETALMAASYSDHLDVVQLLVARGADVNVCNREGATALGLAQDMEVKAVTTYLASQASGARNPAPKEASTKPYDDGPSTSGPAGASAAAAMLQSPEDQSYVRELDLELIPEPGRSAYFAPQQEPETSHAEIEKAELSSDTIPERNGFIAEESGASSAISEKMLADNEEKIVFDAWDNKQVRSVNEKARETVEKATLELGDYTVDTVFKGSYMAVLKPRSQEYKRFKKLWKHPDLIFDPRRWRDWTGASAVKKYCLAEGIDVSSLRATHLIELYYVKDLKLILTLAEEASENNYTVRQLKRAIEELREHRDDHDPGKVIIRTLDQPVPILDDPDLMELCTDKDRVLEELSRAERKKILSLIKARKSGMDESKRLMETLEGILSDLEVE